MPSIRSFIGVRYMFPNSFGISPIYGTTKTNHLPAYKRRAIYFLENSIDDFTYKWAPPHWAVKGMFS